MVTLIASHLARLGARRFDQKQMTPHDAAALRFARSEVTRPPARTENLDAMPADADGCDGAKRRRSGRGQTSATPRDDTEYQLSEPGF